MRSSSAGDVGCGRSIGGGSAVAPAARAADYAPARRVSAPICRPRATRLGAPPIRPERIARRVEGYKRGLFGDPRAFKSGRGRGKVSRIARITGHNRRFAPDKAPPTQRIAHRNWRAPTYCLGLRVRGGSPGEPSSPRRRSGVSAADRAVAEQRIGVAGVRACRDTLSPGFGTRRGGSTTPPQHRKRAAVTITRRPSAACGPIGQRRISADCERGRSNEVQQGRPMHSVLEGWPSPALPAAAKPRELHRPATNRQEAAEAAPRRPLETRRPPVARHGDAETARDSRLAVIYSREGLTMAAPIQQPGALLSHRTTDSQQHQRHAPIARNSPFPAGISLSAPAAITPPVSFDQRECIRPRRAADNAALPRWLPTCCN